MCVVSFLTCMLVTLLIIYLLYSLVILPAYNYANYASSMSMDDVMADLDELQTDNFSALQSIEFQSSSILILDENLDPLFSTDNTIQSQLEKEDVQFLTDYGYFYSDDYEEGYYNYFYITGEDGNKYLYVGLESSTYDSSDEDSDIYYYMQDYILLDEENRIVEGTLFPDMTQLTEKQLTLLLDNSLPDGNYIDRCSYSTLDGKARTLLFLSDSSYSTDSGDSTTLSVAVFWTLLIALLVLLILVETLVMIHEVRRALTPLNEAIVSYRSGVRPDLSKLRLPSEFQDLLTNFGETVDQLEETRERVRQTNEDKQRILTNLSHDLKTPIAVIQGYAQALQDGVVPEEKQSQYLRVICARSDAMLELVTTMLKYSTMEFEGYVLARERTDFCEFCRQYLSQKYEEIEPYGFGLEPEIPEEPIWLLLDQALMRRALDNLIGNTLKYNKPGTVITLRLTTQGNRAELIFADNGAGIPQEILSRAFDPFVSGDAARTSGASSGIGLSIVRSVVELHGGTVTLVTPPEAGFASEFRMLLPLAADLRLLMPK